MRCVKYKNSSWADSPQTQKNKKAVANYVFLDFLTVAFSLPLEVLFLLCMDLFTQKERRPITLRDQKRQSS